jgi:hypothetical protein
MKRNRSGVTGLAVIAAALALPLALTLLRRMRDGDYTTSPEFRAIVGDYLI